MALPLQAGEVVPPRLARTPLDLSEETQSGLMIVVIVALVDFLWRTWR